MEKNSHVDEPKITDQNSPVRESILRKKAVSLAEYLQFS